MLWLYTINVLIYDCTPHYKPKLYVSHILDIKYVCVYGNNKFKGTHTHIYIYIRMPLNNVG